MYQKHRLFSVDIEVQNKALLQTYITAAYRVQSPVHAPVHCVAVFQLFPLREEGAMRLRDLLLQM